MTGGFVGVESRQPMRGVAQTIIAGHGEIGIGARREANLRHPAAAAPGEQGRDGRAIVEEDKAACGRVPWAARECEEGASRRNWQCVVSQKSNWAWRHGEAR